MIAVLSALHVAPARLSLLNSDVVLKKRRQVTQRFQDKVQDVSLSVLVNQ